MYRITDDRQQQCLEKFFVKEKTWYPDYFGCKFAAYMMFVVADAEQLWHYRLAVSLSGRVGVHS